MIDLYNKNLLPEELRPYYSPIDFQFVKNMVYVCKKDEVKGWSTFLFLMVRQYNDYVKRGGDPYTWNKITAENFAQVNPGWGSVLAFFANQLREKDDREYGSIYEFIADQQIPDKGLSVNKTLATFDKSVHRQSRWTASYIRKFYYEMK